VQEEGWRHAMGTNDIIVLYIYIPDNIQVVYISYYSSHIRNIEDMLS